MFLGKNIIRFIDVIKSVARWRCYAWRNVFIEDLALVKYGDKEGCQED